MSPARATMSYMKNETVTVRLDPDLREALAAAAERLGRPQSEIVRDALRRQLALLQFEQLRAELMPLAEAQGIVTDEDVFRVVS